MSEERMRILEMVREGKITAEEGARLIEALKAPSSDKAAAGDGGGRAERTDDPFSHLGRVVAEVLQAQGWGGLMSGRGGRGGRGDWGHWGDWGSWSGHGSPSGEERRRARQDEGWEFLTFSEGDHGTFEVAPGSRVTVRSDAGSIEAIAGDGPARLELEGDSFNHALYVARKDRELEISAYRTAQYARLPRLKVYLPRDTQVVEQITLRTAGGGLHARAFACPLTLKTAAGSITVREHGPGGVEAHTSGGSIQVDGQPARVELHTSGGGIKFAGRTQGFDARTSGGSIAIDGAHLITGEHRAKTAGGSIRVRLTPESSVDLTAQTSAGSIDVSLPGVQGEQRGSRISPKYHGQFHGGGARLEMSTAAGSIQVGLIEDDAAGVAGAA